jgi:hypothetical protein
MRGTSDTEARRYEFIPSCRLALRMEGCAFVVNGQCVYERRPVGLAGGVGGGSTGFST